MSNHSDKFSVSTKLVSSPLQDCSASLFGNGTTMTRYPHDSEQSSQNDTTNTIYPDVPEISNLEKFMMLDYEEFSNSSEKCNRLERYIEHIPTPTEQFTVLNSGYIKYEQIEVPLQLIKNSKIDIKNSSPICSIRVKFCTPINVINQVFLSINKNNVMCSRITSSSSEVEFNFNSPKISNMLKSYLSQISGKNYLYTDSLDVEVYTSLEYSTSNVNIIYEVLNPEKTYTILESKMYHIGKKYSFSSFLPTSSLEVIATKDSDISIEFPGDSNIEYEIIRLHPVRCDNYAINKYEHTLYEQPENLYKFVIMLKYKSNIPEESVSTRIVPERCKSRMINFSKLNKKPIITISNGEMRNLYQNRWTMYHNNGMPRFVH